MLTDGEWQQYIANALHLGGTPQPPFAEQGCVQERFSRFAGRIYIPPLIQITEGKTKAAKRMLPMVPSVYSALKSRHEASGKSESGCVFPSSSAEGHFNKDAAKDQHAKAIGKADQKAGKAKYRKLLVRRGDSNPHGFTRQIRTLHAKLPRGDALWRNTGRVRLAPLRSIRTSLARIATPK